MLVAKHLNFNMAGIDDEFFHENPVVAERGFRLGFRARKAFGDLLPRVGDAHALAAAARGGLDHHGIADFVGDFGCMFRALDHAEEAGDRRDFRRVSEFLRFDLVAHRPDRARVRADENDAGLGERFGKGGALGKKAIARMHRLGAGFPGRGDDLFDHEIGLGGRRRTDRHRLVGHLDVQRILVGLGINRDRLYAHAARRLDDPARDLATIGDQDFLEHRPPGRGPFPGPA